MGLRNHQSPIPNVVPPLEYVREHVQQDPEFGHWFWRERKGKRVHDSYGQAVVIWHVKATHKTHFVSRGRYNVARLLIEALQGPIPPRTSVVSLCGLPQCVNPHHWGRHERVPPFRYALGSEGVWQVVAARTENEIAEAVTLRVRTLDGTVHVSRAEPGRLHGAICGAAIDPSTSVIVESLVTCKAGC